MKIIWTHQTVDKSEYTRSEMQVGFSPMYPNLKATCRRFEPPYSCFRSWVTVRNSTAYGRRSQCVSIWRHTRQSGAFHRPRYLDLLTGRVLFDISHQECPPPTSPKIPSKQDPLGTGCTITLLFSSPNITPLTDGTSQISKIKRPYHFEKNCNASTYKNIAKLTKFGYLLYLRVLYRKCKVSIIGRLVKLFQCCVSVTFYILVRIQIRRSVGTSD